jgi:ubiquinone/menaquinone biosynthesis C-methylase UbiE
MSNDPVSRNAKRYQRALKSITGLQDKMKILDIGCQSGDFCAELKKLGHEPYGIEIVAEAVADAQGKHPDIPFVLANCESKIPFPDSSFDVIWAGEVIEHIGHTDLFINEINRVLKVGGHLILSTPMHNRLKSLYIVLFRFEKHFNPEFPHYRFYSKKSFSAVLERRGFRIVECDYIGRLPVVANVILISAEKVATKAVLSDFRQGADNRDPQ